MTMPMPTYPEELLGRNDRIGRKVVRAYKKLEDELKDLGVQRKPRYSLEPPLGRNPTACDNRASRG